MLDRLFRRRRDTRAATEFFVKIVGQARDPVFYRDLGVPDTLDGRFDMVVLHVFLVMHRLKGQGAAAADWSRQLYETMIDNFEKSLMEQGVGDSGISRRVKTMARGMAGRIQAYDRALAPGAERDPLDGGLLEVALDNNVYGTAPDADRAHLAAMTAYVRRQVAGLAEQPLESLLAGQIHFSPVHGDGDHFDGAPDARME
ncbi:ubiquinol-cytochrome C chaperone family protein [Azospirillum canadense]|uniref:ubiquinol-cytochrome C chaperone family protein n=1 Tax=Azospirillum canadense TaxID=403962 RepID=UPI0022278FC1|nr:ubiquinol-cytochrome C chaperone family protein [Azospirillum canadense]MCW2237144.1 cytochrome b pre-mRNA-processing protein 3 [Azospirillum canadense]